MSNGTGASKGAPPASPSPPTRGSTVRDAPKPEQAAQFANRLGQAEKQFKAKDVPGGAKKLPSALAAAPAAAGQPKALIGSDGKLPLSRKGKVDDERRDEPSHAPVSATAVRSLDAAPVAPVAPASLPDDTRVLDRMAAAIAECCASKRDPQFTLQFAAGSIAEGVLLGRAANGAIAVQIVGLDARMSPTQAERMRSGLSDALLKRRLRLDGVTLERPVDALDAR